jgi:uncharacterized protein (TIGR02996 family)
MGTEEAFWQAILDEPDDDTPRLVYADWLDEQGQADRAELIRVQCELERLPADDPRRQALGTQAEKLVCEHGKSWLGPLYPFYEYQTGMPFRRGSAEVLGITPGAFLSRSFQKTAAPWLARLAVSQLRLHGATSRVARLLESPLLEPMRALTWTQSKLGDEGLAALARCPRLAKLRELHLEKPFCSISGLEHLAQSPYLESLEILRLETVNAGPFSKFRGVGAAVRILLEGSRLRSLRYLALPNGQLGLGSGADLADLTRVAGLSRLKTLDLHGNHLRREAARHLAGCSHLAELKELELRSNRLDDADVNALLDSPCLAQLEYLGLDHQYRFRYEQYFHPVSEETKQRYRQRFGRDIK